MKTGIIRTFLLAAAVFACVSCTSFWENTLSRQIKIAGKEVVAPLRGKQSKAAASDEVLFRHDLTLGIAKQLQKNGFDMENLKVLTLDRAVLEVVSPADFKLDELMSLKIFFDDEKIPVVIADKIEDGKLLFKAVQPQLIEKAKDDKFNIIIKGQEPSKDVVVKITMDYLAKVSLIK